MSKNELLTVVDLEEGFKKLLGGEAPAAICEELALSGPEFTRYVKDRVREISERDLAQQKAFILGRLEEFLASVWVKKKESPQWANVVLGVISQQAKIVLGQGVPVAPDSGKQRLGDVVDMKKAAETRRDFEAKKKAAKR